MDAAMVNDWWQHAVVTLAAVAACVVVAWRLFGFFGTREKGAGCATCQSGQSACATSTPAAADTRTSHPLVFIRPGR